MAEGRSDGSMRCEVSLVKTRSVKVALPTSSSMQPACPVRRKLRLQKREDPAALPLTGSPRVQKGGADRSRVQARCHGSASRRRPDLRAAHAASCNRHVHFLPAELLELCRWTARYYLVSLAEVIATIVPRTLPPRLSERVVRLVRRLDDDAGRALARRAPARAHAYRTLLAAENGELVEAAARSAGIPATALRGLVAAGLAETIVREPCPAVPHDERSADRPLLMSAQRSAVEA